MPDLDIGNVDVLFDRTKVGGYFTSSPSLAEKDCLRDFMQAIRTGTRTVPYKSVGKQFLIAVCQHVLQVAFKGNRMFVTDIHRGVL